MIFTYIKNEGEEKRSSFTLHTFTRHFLYIFEMKKIKLILMFNFNRIIGQLHRRRDPRDDGQKEEHPKHVRYRARGPRQVDIDRLVGLESWYYCRRKSW